MSEAPEPTKSPGRQGLPLWFAAGGYLLAAGMAVVAVGAEMHPPIVTIAKPAPPIATTAESSELGSVAIALSSLAPAGPSAPRASATSSIGITQSTDVAGLPTFAPAAWIPTAAPEPPVITLTNDITTDGQTASAIDPALLAQLVTTCASDVSVATQTAVISVESSGDAWALHDDDDGRVYHPTSYAAALQLAHSLIDHDRITYGTADAGVDVGIGQINSRNFSAFGVTTADMLHPCSNLRVSSHLLASNYQQRYAALSALPTHQRVSQAADEALEMYQSGQPYGDLGYAANVRSALRGEWAQRIIALAGHARIPEALAALPGSPLLVAPASTSPRPRATLTPSETGSVHSDEFVQDPQLQPTSPPVSVDIAAAPSPPPSFEVSHDRPSSDSSQGGEFYHEDLSATPEPSGGAVQPTPRLIPVPVNNLPADAFVTPLP